MAETTSIDDDIFEALNRIMGIKRFTSYRRTMEYVIDEYYKYIFG